MSKFKVGDKVAVGSYTSWGLSTQVRTIDRETTTQWVVGDDRFRKSDLRLIGHKDRFRSAPRMFALDSEQVKRQLAKDADAAARNEMFAATDWIARRKSPTSAEIQGAIDALVVYRDQRKALSL